MALARDLAARLGIEWGGGTLVCPPIDDADRVRAALGPLVAQPMGAPRA